MFNFVECSYLCNHSLNCLHIWYMIYLQYLLGYGIQVLGFGPLVRRAVTSQGLVYVRVSCLNFLVAYSLDFVHI